jgi:hypothetical protein
MEIIVTMVTLKKMKHIEMDMTNFGIIMELNGIKIHLNGQEK